MYGRVQIDDNPDTLTVVYTFLVTMEEQGSNGTESLTMTVPTTITASQISQIAQQVTYKSPDVVNIYLY